jgi:hypothetical protein
MIRNNTLKNLGKSLWMLGNLSPMRRFASIGDSSMTSMTQYAIFKNEATCVGNKILII